MHDKLTLMRMVRDLGLQLAGCTTELASYEQSEQLVRAMDQDKVSSL